MSCLSSPMLVYRSLTKLFNDIKQQLVIPDFFSLMSITSLYKNRGLKSDLSNERGIFNISKVRSIFDKVIYADVYDIIDSNMSFSNVGGRKQRNIRDNLFVIYAAINYVINGGGSSFDMQGYDVIKCFDEMWYQETHNDLWDVQIQNDKFSLISKLDEYSKVVVKTPSGTTDSFELEKVILQGSVFGPIKCSVQMDTLGRECLKKGFGIYKFRNTIDVPGLAMIDDVMGLATCGDQSLELNAIINSKMEHKKLRLSEDKCYKIHICKKSDSCPQVLKVHDKDMKTVMSATYLGDVLSEKGTIDETVSQRCQKAIGIISQVSSMLSSVCLGSFYIDIALVLRDAKLVNSIMVNSEVWHNVHLKHIQSLEKADSDLLRTIMNSHSKTAIEAYFFELGKFPLRFTLAKRRFMYYWHILHRDDSELICKIYTAQTHHANRGDWVKIMNEEKTKHALLITDQEIQNLSQEKFKTIVNEKIEKSAIAYLQKLAGKHSKTNCIAKEKFGRKEYLTDIRFSKEDIQLLFSLRTKMVDVKSNFGHLYEDDNFNCRICMDVDSFEDENHLLLCEKLNDEKYDIRYSDVYSTVDKQLVAVRIFKKILRRRNVYLDAIDT